MSGCDFFFLDVAFFAFFFGGEVAGLLMNVDIALLDDDEAEDVDGSDDLTNLNKLRLLLASSVSFVDLLSWLMKPVTVDGWLGNN